MAEPSAPVLKKEMDGTDGVWDPHWVPLFKAIQNGGVKSREAIEVGTKAVEYFRGVDLARWVRKRQKALPKSFPRLFDGQKDVDCSDVIQSLIAKGFLLRAIHKPVGVVADEEDDTKTQQILKEAAKWPRRLQITPSNQQFDEESFYIIIYNPSTKWNYIYLGLVIAAVFSACLFPIWPFRLKVAMWYLGVVFATLMAILIVLRLIGFLGMWFAGCDFWILPNLFDEEAGIIDSFIPLYSFVRRKDDWIMFVARAFCAVICVVGFYKLGETHSLSDVSGFASKQFLDIMEWGHKKLGEAPANPVEPEADVVPETPDQRHDRFWNICLTGCDFVDTAEFDDVCAEDCECLTELIGSKCWRKCEAEIINELKMKEENCSIREKIKEEEVEVDGDVENDSVDELKKIDIKLEL